MTFLRNHYEVSELILVLLLHLLLCYSSHLFFGFGSCPRHAPLSTPRATDSTSSVFYIILYLMLLLLLLWFRPVLFFYLFLLLWPSLRDSQFSQWLWQIGAAVNGTQCGTRALHVDYIKRSTLICMSRTHIEYIPGWAGEAGRGWRVCSDPVKRLQFHASSRIAPSRSSLWRMQCNAVS